MDTLNLANEEDIKLLFETEGYANEKVLLSEMITKVNAKGRNQKRILMITQKAIYNLKPKKLTKSQRRITIGNIGMITLSSMTPEFVIHVPSEYDYHLISKNKIQICEQLQSLFFKTTMTELMVVYSELQHLKSIVLTKKLAKYEDTQSKHHMKESMGNVLKGVDPNELDDQDDEQNQIDANQLNPNQNETEEDGGDDNLGGVNNNKNIPIDRYASLASQSALNNAPHDDIAVYQSVVYGNDQLLLRQGQPPPPAAR
eukprot:271637_1